MQVGWGEGAGEMGEGRPAGRDSGDIGRGYVLREMGRGQGPLGQMPVTWEHPWGLGGERGMRLLTDILPLQGPALGLGAQ